MMLNCNLEKKDCKKLVELITIYTKTFSCENINSIISLLEEYISCNLGDRHCIYTLENLTEDLIYMSSKHGNLNLLSETLLKWKLPVICYNSIIITNIKKYNHLHIKKYINKHMIEVMINNGKNN